ncbi:src-like-adapter 2 isoform X3 [Bos indicus]|uniref:Src-like-adapter 2 isoform X3 n=1 Tax=Bos indicus TaxID=9915 RepID=A0ABM4TCF4_BOSIN|nr:src-like-adapter 2 isoform X1 [Bos taurus]
MGSQPSRGKALPSPSFSPCVQGQNPEPMQAERSRAKAVALGSFPVGEQAELSLRLGEPLTIISEDGDWWTVLSDVSGREYSIPSIHVARIAHGWLYEGLSREKAEELLLLPGNHGGAFLIRESQTRRDGETEAHRGMETSHTAHPNGASPTPGSGPLQTKHEVKSVSDALAYSLNCSQASLTAGTERNSVHVYVRPFNCLHTALLQGQGLYFQCSHFTDEKTETFREEKRFA